MKKQNKKNNVLEKIVKHNIIIWKNNSMLEISFNIKMSLKKNC